jgi:four helix bundle protein
MTGEGQRPEDLKSRTRNFALRVVRLYSALPKQTESQVIGKQLLRAGTSVGAHYREGLRARSKSEYAAKLNAGLMELEETLYWLELLEGSGIISGRRLAPLKTEVGELSAIFVTLIKQARKIGNRALTAKIKNKADVVGNSPSAF